MNSPVSPNTLSAMGEKSGRFGRAIRQLREASATWRLIRILLIVQLIPVIWDRLKPAAGKLPQAQQLLGLTKSEVFSGDIWQPFSYAFIHANWFHLLANAACIILLGSKLERIVSKRTFWLLGLFSVLAGGALFLLFIPAAPLSPDNFPQTLVGSSGICFGFLLLLTTLSPDSKFLPLFLSGRSLGIGIIFANLILTLLNPDLPTGPFARAGTYLSENVLTGLFTISHACHLGGSIAGWLYAKYLLRPRVSIDSLRRTREKAERSSRESSAKTSVS